MIALLSVCLSLCFFGHDLSANADNSSRADLLLVSTEERRRKPVQTAGVHLSGRGSGPNYIAYFFVVIDSKRWYKLNLSDQAQFNLQLKVVSLSHLVSRFLNSPPLSGVVDGGWGLGGVGAKSSFTVAGPHCR